MTRPLLALGVSLLLFASSPVPVLTQNLTADQLSAVKAALWRGAQQSWELGTECEALTESNAPAYAVFNSSLPPPSSPLPSSLAPVLAIAHDVVRNQSNISGPAPLVYTPDGAAGDPASLGVAVLLANWTGAGAQDGLDYARAAQGQLAYTLDVVPRTNDGAISHRIEQVELWSDSVYMVPPFLAYYGALSANESLLSEAYTQIKLYRQYLYDSGPGLWKHIVLGNATDPGHWSTGNGWAAAGMLRVLATMQHSQYAGKMKSEMKDLVDWVQDIHNGMYATLVRSPSFRRNSPSLIHPISSRARSRSLAPPRSATAHRTSRATCSRTTQTTRARSRTRAARRSSRARCTASRSRPACTRTCRSPSAAGRRCPARGTSRCGARATAPARRSPALHRRRRPRSPRNSPPPSRRHRRARPPRLRARAPRLPRRRRRRGRASRTSTRRCGSRRWSTRTTGRGRARRRPRGRRSSSRCTRRGRSGSTRARRGRMPRAACGSAAARRCGLLRWSGWCSRGACCEAAWTGGKGGGLWLHPRTVTAAVLLLYCRGDRARGVTYCIQATLPFLSVLLWTYVLYSSV
ncbi:hypothetical protein AcV5_001913 [Taiwanofungus camphoratus]|nr:hypothetical protein AcV5_001913 [Antrodia cinnamomea]